MAENNQERPAENPEQREEKKQQLQKKIRQTRERRRRNILYGLGMRWRIFIYLLGFALVMIFLLWMMQIVYLDDFYEHIKKEQISTAAVELAGNLEQEDLQAYTENVALHSNLCARIFRLDNKSGIFFGAREVASVDLLGDCIIHHIADMEINRLYYQAQGSSEDRYMEIFSRVRFGESARLSENPGGLVPVPDEGLSKSLVYASLAEDSLGNEYLILLNSSITPVSATVQTLRIQLVAISAALILLALIISYIIARRLSSPISKLNKAARRMATGDLSGNFPAEGYKEIAVLADTLNYASSELERTDRLQKDLVANISHDIRTPLTMIGGYAEYMRDFPDEDHSESIQVIIDESERLRDLVNDILDNSRIMAGVSEIKACLFDFSEFISGFVSNYNHLLEPQGIVAEPVITPGIHVLGDEKRLLQAVSNMMNNAVAHIGADRRIQVRLEIAPPMPAEKTHRRLWPLNQPQPEQVPSFCYNGASPLNCAMRRSLELQQEKEAEQRESKRRKAAPKAVARLTITDHGCGIPAGALPHIWDRYYHADSPSRSFRGNHGSGLGLCIVRGIMELHHARYGVQSKEGQGTSFWFELPLAGGGKDGENA